MSLRTQTWVVWLVVTALAVSLARHPLYCVVVLAAIRFVSVTCRRQERTFNVSLWRIGLVIITLAALLNALFVHVGATVWARLPAQLWLIGGNLTVEALVYGAINGLVLVALLAAFVAFNEIVAVHDLVRIAPRAFRDLGIIVLVAVTYVPETQRHWQRIREAQAIRGHVLHGVRDWRPLIIPLLVGGLERALNLAEAMISRGYGAAQETALQARLRLLLLAALFLTLGGWGLALWLGAPGWGVMLLGLCVMGAVLWRLGRAVHVTVYRPKPITSADIITVSAMVVLTAIVFWWRDALAYSPYPRLSVPPFDPWLAAALLLLTIPGWLQRMGAARD